MREITCPGCGEVLGVPKELEGGAIRCGVCERIIQPRDFPPSPAPRSRMSEEPDERRDPPRERSRYRDGDDDRQEQDDRGGRGRFDDEDRPRRPRSRSRAEDDDFDRPKKKSGCGVWVWIIGIFTVLILGCCGLGGFAVYKFGDPKWERFNPPDSRWSAEFPGKPKMEIKPVEGVAGGNATYYTGERALGREAYLVGYGELTPAELRFNTNDRAMEEGLDGIKKGTMTVKEVSRRNLKMAGVDAKEGTFDVTDPKLGTGRMVVRILIADNRIYTLIAVKMGKGASNPEHMDRFFDSFQITAIKK